jgi:NAD(P)-dependent dehydrogenase (short-subunit alcohol dehydrogenase family)
VRLTHALLTHLEKNRGVVINVSSNLGLRPIPRTSAYSASKAAMINWTQSLAIELGPTGVRANCVCPGIIDTPIQAFHGQSAEQKAALGNLQPIGRIGVPDDVAYAIWSLCGPGSEWMTGSVLTVDGGISLV